MISGPGDPNAWWSAHGPEAVLAYRIRTLRRARNWSQADLAAKMKDLGFAYHQNTVSRIESGSQSVTLNEAAALAMIFSVGADELFMPGRNEEVLERLTVRRDDLAATLHDLNGKLAAADQEVDAAERDATLATTRAHEARNVLRELLDRRAELEGELSALHRQLEALKARPSIHVDPGGKS